MPLETTTVQRIVDENLARLQWETQTQGWGITLKLEAGPTKAMASVKLYTDYRVAEMFLDPAQHDNEQEVIDSLRHELFHVLLAPYNVYRDIVRDLIGFSERGTVENRAWHTASELAVGNLERALKHGAAENPFPAQGKRRSAPEAPGLPLARAAHLTACEAS